MTTLAKIQDTDIEVIKGETFVATFSCVDGSGTGWDFTGYTAIGQVRNKWNDTGTPIITFSTANGKITFVGSNMIITLPPTDTTSISMTPGLESKDFVYDVELTSPAGVIKKPLRGAFIVYAESTI
jgi:hypothetical protein